MLKVAVHGNKICLDLLSDYNSYFAAGDPGAEGVTSGWSPAYTVGTILLQLQSTYISLLRFLLPSISCPYLLQHS